MNSSLDVRTFQRCPGVSMWGTMQIGYLASCETVSGQSDRIGKDSNWEASS